MAVPVYGTRKGDEATGPQSEVLGTIKPNIADSTPLREASAWASATGETVQYVEGPPPWELPGNDQYTLSDARRYVDVPEDWVLRWINPKLLDANGWNYWRAVTASDTRVTIKVRTMVTVDNLIRRGGPTGDILAWMPREWVESRRRQFQTQTDQLTQSAVDRQGELKEDFARGKYGRYVKLVEARHPTHTMGEGRTMTD